jgi:ligand-binding sensor domain-containing protein
LPGEPQGYVRDIVIDGAGRVWVANPGGVHVLDTDDSAGTSTWTTFTTADGLPNDWATALAIDENGHVWVGTRDGIGVFDGSAWITFTSADGLGGSWVKTIAIDAPGQVWVGVDEKLCRFDGKALRAEPQDSACETVEDALTRITAIDFDLAGRVWVGHQQGISVLDGTGWTHYTSANDFALHSVNDVTIDPQDNVWVSNGGCIFHSADCTNIGLSQFDGQSWINSRETSAHNNNSGDLVYDIAVVAVDHAGDVWVGVASGVMRFDGQSWTTYTQADGLTQDTRYGGTVYAIAIDSMGRKWLGSQTELIRIDDAY